MKVFNQTILICSIVAAIILCLFALSHEGIGSGGVLLFMGSPIVFIVGVIVSLLGTRGSDTRQAGQGIMLSSLIYLLVGFTTCSMGGGIHI
jgi:hypothetical protein